MAEISQITDRKSLKAWLDGLPQETEAQQVEARRIAVSIASRAAARVLPEFWHWVLTSDHARKRDLTALPVLRGPLISSVAGFTLTEEISKAAAAAAKAAAIYPAIATAAAKAATIYAANAAAANAAAANAANAANAAAANAAAAKAANAANAYAYAAAAADAANANAFAADAAFAAADAAIWDGVRGDAEVLLGADPDAFAHPLWPDDAPNFETFQQIRDDPAIAGPNSPWGFWIEWYARLLRGTPEGDSFHPGSAMMQEVALLPDDVWNDTAEALRQINEIWDRHRGKAAPEIEALQRADDGVVVQYDPVLDAFSQVDVPADTPRPLELAVAKLQEFNALAGAMGNLEGVLRSELLLVRRAVEDHGANPVMVYNNCGWALQILRGNLASGGCPSPDVMPEVGLFETLLLDVQSGLRSEPLVAESIGFVPDDTPLLEQAEELAVIEAAALDLAELSEGSLAQELPVNAREARDGFLPKAQRVAGLVRTVSAVVQAWILARYQNFKTVLSETEDVSGRLLKISKNVAGIGATAGAAYAALQAVSGSPKVAAAIEAIVKFF